jgi:hypothetical protein
VTKRPKFLARLGSRHRPSSRTPPNALPSETVYQWNKLVPFDFGVVSQRVRSYAGGAQVSRTFPTLPYSYLKKGPDLRPRSIWRWTPERLTKKTSGAAGVCNFHSGQFIPLEGPQSRKASGLPVVLSVRYLNASRNVSSQLLLLLTARMALFRMRIETCTRNAPPSESLVLLRPSGRDSGLYLKLVTRVYLIEKATFRWYCLLSS